MQRSKDEKLLATKEQRAGQAKGTWRAVRAQEGSGVPAEESRGERLKGSSEREAGPRSHSSLIFSHVLMGAP